MQCTVWDLTMITGRYLYLDWSKSCKTVQNTYVG